MEKVIIQRKVEEKRRRYKSSICIIDLVKDQSVSCRNYEDLQQEMFREEVTMFGNERETAFQAFKPGIEPVPSKQQLSIITHLGI